MASFPTIGSAAAPSQTFDSTSRTGLRAQIARDEKELSACVNCSSASTLEGKQNIQRIGEEIQSLKARLSAVGKASASSAPTEQVSATATPRATRVDIYA